MASGRRLNNLTDHDTYPLPHIHSFADHLHGMKLYSKVDLKDAFLQIPVHPSDIAKTTITTPFGAYHYNYMPFGLSGAAQTFQRFIDTVMRDLTTDSGRVVTAFADVDDILIASRDEKTHLEDLRDLFQRLAQYGLRISPLKSLFGQDSIEFLGHSITMEGVAPLPEKVSAMRSFSQPRDAKEMRRYLGMLNFYRRFLNNAATVLIPLYDIIKFIINFLLVHLLFGLPNR